MRDSSTGPRLIGHPQRRPNIGRLLEGRGSFVDDIHLPGLLHIAFLRSPYAHAMIVRLDCNAAAAIAGVIRIVTAADLQDVCKGWATSPQFKGMVHRVQEALAGDQVYYQGQPVAAVVAEDRALAEDVLELIEVEWEELPAAAVLDVALQGDAELVHIDLASNLAFSAELGAGDVNDAFSRATTVVEETFRFGRVTGTPMETRGVVASYIPADRSLTVYQSHTTPHTLQSVYADFLGLDEHRVRVVCPNVGGSFGVKIHVYADEVATCAISRLLGRPVKFIADRIESFVSDIHAREHRIRARMALGPDGEILGYDAEDLFGIGPFSNYPMSSAHEGMGAVRMMMTPYRVPAFRGRLQVAFQNKTITGQYRGVGHPIACAVSEYMIEKAAREIDVPSEELRRRNYFRDEDYPCTFPTGIKLEELSHQKCLERLEAMMNLPALRAEQAELRKRGIFRGVGLAAFVELTAPGPAAYGNLGVPITTQDAIVLRVEPSGQIRCLVSVTDQGQGTDTVIGQVVADTLGVAMKDVLVLSGDSALSPYGGGAWASRGASVGGELALRAALALRRNVLDCAAPLLQVSAENLLIHDGVITPSIGSQIGMSLAKLADIVQFRPQLLPSGPQPQLSVSMQFGHDWPPYALTNGIQASHLEIDTLTGRIRLLGHWAVDDFGTVINPMLVSEQVRGGIVQGIGEVLFEEIIYSDTGQLLNGSFVDYLLPKSSEMPDIAVDHVETPWSKSLLGAKGAGEAGMTAAVGAVLNAVNDALCPFNCAVTTVPITPTRILQALGKIPD